MIGGIPLRIIALFVMAAAGQVSAIGLLPRTQGFTNLGYTLGCMVSFYLSLWLIARILQSGVNLGILVSLMSAVSPLGGVLVAIFVYGEHASLPKVAALVMACGLIGWPRDWPESMSIRGLSAPRPEGLQNFISRNEPRSRIGFFPSHSIDA